ncbi:MED6-domain-containing protein [Canariomyces notabilis]|uniref:Mediator of RNA polymerase II transcription subunit 6 n=1 Tax=Canariomyces notabilis TaxID=2074819 RepID=A0AAN6TA45_9PEZI|nr:MED6-domain-containing protein [Canariomyces arenarius]
MASELAANTGPPLDEIQWRAPPDFEQGIHSNSVLYYFAQSPFFDKTSNNEVVFQQGLNNPNMTQFLATRELFEGRLKTMSGLEFVVAQEPAETGPGAGTGVWVINKQTRRKRQGEEDEIIVHATYFIVGENIYMAPTLGDIISSRIASISSSIAKPLPIAASIQSWSASLGRVYQTPTGGTQTTTGTKTQREATPLPPSNKPTASNQPSPRFLEEALAIHHQFGEQYMDENPITGKPGEFHLSSTGRKGPAVNLSAAAAANLKKPTLLPALPTLNTKLAAENPLAGGKAGKETKSPRTPGGSATGGGSGLQKGKKRKGSKAVATPS